MVAPQPRVLIVDDNNSVLMTTECMLKRAGYEVWTALNGETALPLLREQSFALMLLDLHLPGLNGLELAKLAYEMQPEAAIVILTGSGAIDDELVESALQGFPVVRKTIAPQELLAYLAEQLAL